MIGMLTGTCLMAGSGEAILDVGGVGYLIQCGIETTAQINIGETLCLHVETHVRENAIILYGFLDEERRVWFVRLQSVQGVGPKAALAILDSLTPGDILAAIEFENKTAFSKASGVGPKLAGRIVSELAGKAPPTGRSGLGITMETSIKKPASSPNTDKDVVSSERQVRRDAVSALTNLGIGEVDAMRCVNQAYTGFSSPPSLDDLIRVALQEIGG